VIDENRPESITLAEQFRSDECAALLDLSEAVANGELASAEAAYRKIGDDSPAAIIRDSGSVQVVISPGRFVDRMKQIASSKDAPGLARFRAMMALGSDDIDKILAQLGDEQRSQFGDGVTRFFRLRKLMNDGHWTKALKSVDRMLASAAHVASYWEMKSDILAELGDHSASAESLEKAIELEPLRVSTREKSLNRTAIKLSFSDYLCELDSLLAEDPDDKRLLFGRAAAMQDGPDGLAYERAANEAIRWFPRDPNIYSELGNWYQSQERNDLAQQLHDKARLMLPEEFVGDQTNSDGKNATRDDAAANDSESIDKDDDNVPTDNDELLNLIWDRNDKRRTEALRRILQFETEAKLQWHQRARLLSCRLLIPDQEGDRTIDADALLPEQTSGAVHWFVRAVCQSITN